MCGVCVCYDRGGGDGGDAGVVRGYGDMEMEMDMGLCGRLYVRETMRERGTR